MPAATEATHTVKIEDSGPARKRLTITIPAQAVDSRLRESLASLTSETALPGFRKGRAPGRLLERRFGPTMRNEAKGQLIANAYAATIEEHNIKPLGEPEPVGDLASIELKAGEPLTFTLEVEVMPQFELPAMEGIEIKKPILPIAEERIAEELRRHQYLQGTSKEIQEHFGPLDRLLGYATVTREGEPEPFFRQDNVAIIVPEESEGGRGQVLGLMIEGLDALLKDKKVGDAITIQTVGPDLHEREDIRGAKLTISFDIRGAHHIEPVEAAVVAERFGLPSVELLREQIKMALEHRRDDEQAAAMREQVLDRLSERVTIDLPEKLSANQASSLLENQRIELLYRGLTPEETEQKLAEMRGDTEEQARERVKRFFILNKLAEQFKIEVTEQEVNGRIAAIAAQRNVRPERLRAELAQAGRLGEVSRVIRDQKAADRVVAQAKKVDVSAEEWNQMFLDRQRQQKAARVRANPSAAAKSADEDSKAVAAAADEKPARKKSGKSK